MVNPAKPMTTFFIVGFLLFSVIASVTLAVAIKNAKDDSVDEWGFPREMPAKVLVRRNNLDDR